MLVLILVLVEARRGGRSSDKKSKSYAGVPSVEGVIRADNVFSRGKGKGGSKSSKKRGKGKNGGKGKDGGKGKSGSKSSKKRGKGKGKGAPPGMAFLTFSRRMFPVGQPFEFDAIVRAVNAEEVDFFNLYSFDTDTGQGNVPITILIPIGPAFSTTFQGRFTLTSNFPGEFFGFRAIPVIHGVEDPHSSLVVTDPHAIRSIRGRGTPSPSPASQPPTAAPTGPTTSRPTSETPEQIAVQGTAGAEFGFSIAVSGDASFLAVGAPANSELAVDAGRVALYQLSGETATLLFEFSGAQAGLQVGLSLSISSIAGPDGPILAVGGSEFVDVYPLNQFLGTQPPTLDFDRFAAEFTSEGFGSAVDVSGDGNFLTVGAPLGSFTLGLAQVYRIDTGLLIGIDILGDNNDDRFGTAVALSGDGAIFAGGAPGIAGANGYARVYRFVSGTWTPTGQTLIGSQAGDKFGTSISLSDDGGTVAIGANQAGTGPGFVRIFQLVGVVWLQIGQTLEGTNTNDMFGTSVALTPDGRFVSIGAPAFDGGRFTDNGIVQVFENVSGVWVQAGDIIGSTNTRNLGTSVAISSDGQTVAAGGPRSTSLVGRDVGEAVVFIL